MNHVSRSKTAIFIFLCLISRTALSDCTIQPIWFADIGDIASPPPPPPYPTAGYAGYKSLAVLPDGSLVAAGSGSHAGWIIRKYSQSTGDVIWTRTGIAGTRPTGITTDPSGNILVVGYEPAWKIKKYDGTGNLLWEYADTGTPYCIAADPAGNSYVGGYRNGWTVCKYSPTGSVLWISSLPSGTPYGIAIDNSGNAVSVGADNGWKVRWHDSAGNIAFTATAYGTPQGIAIDTAGDITVVGSQLFPASKTEMLVVRRYNPSGIQAWENLRSTPGHPAQRAASVVNDGSSNSIVTGVEVHPEGSVDNLCDMLTIKYDHSGNTIWAATYHTGNLGAESAGSIQLLSNGNIAIAGSVNTFEYTHGTVLIAKQPDCPGNSGTNSGDLTGADRVKIVGGIRGYIDPRKGEQANILVKPTGVGLISLKIYDSSGQLVRKVEESYSGSGTATLKWDGKDSGGNRVPPGFYPALITAPGISYRDKLAVL